MRFDHAALALQRVHRGVAEALLLVAGEHDAGLPVPARRSMPNSCKARRCRLNNARRRSAAKAAGSSPVVPLVVKQMIRSRA